MAIKMWRYKYVIININNINMWREWADALCHQIYRQIDRQIEKNIDNLNKFGLLIFQ